MLSLSFDHLPRPKPVALFRGHSEIVWSVVFLPNGTELASASSDGSIRLWNLESASEVTLGKSNGAVFCLALFPDGKRLASGGLDRSVNVWDVNAQWGPVDGPWKRHTSSVRYLDISSDCRYLVSGSFDHNVNVWDTENGYIIRDETYLKGDGEINCVKFSKDGKLLTGSRDGCLRIWDWGTGNLLVGPMKADETPIWAIAWSRDETQILSGSGDGILRRWQTSTGRLIGDVHAHAGTIFSLSVSNNDCYVASASSDCNVKIWNAVTFEQIAILNHPDEVNCIAFSTDDRFLATACSDATIYIWELPQTSLDSGLVIDREYEGASLLERPMVPSLDCTTMMGDNEASRRNTKMLNEVLDVQAAAPLSPESVDPVKEGQVDNVVPTVVENRRPAEHLGFIHIRRRCRMDSVNDVQEPRRWRHKLSQMIKVAIAKSRKLISNLW